MHPLSRTLVAALGVTGAGCASTGGIPEAGDPGAAIAGAEALIQEAQRAGADSLAAEPLAMARQTLAAAKLARDDRDTHRAALLGREAQADATYAKEAAERARAQRARDDAATAMRQLPPEGR